MIKSQKRWYKDYVDGKSTIESESLSIKEDCMIKVCETLQPVPTEKNTILAIAEIYYDIATQHKKQVRSYTRIGDKPASEHYTSTFWGVLFNNVEMPHLTMSIAVVQQFLEGNSRQLPPGETEQAFNPLIVFIRRLGKVPQIIDDILGYPDESQSSFSLENDLVMNSLIDPLNYIINNIFHISK